ncbi:PTS system, lactose cellobiose IIC component family protein [Lapidilactobacillus dextrinicus DSM 20335]|uniref:Permease IIC component n=1 Tax=Lapidilactobacillus dextrinicus DSM 20335 TaxID=1423738 RepID=A0A0R2BH03_9LACO|nr:PTS transporter subunit EIIC [Lapidilactobacillus dextrinicus]KRM78744.1 PTS system, lactose cellobiose IIC component family protein [Lapidilactobacillus dextrinicus DSM 20335]QFG47467.1 PTS sugar transporter subunit IIC [Lapidilactobacillus dextrinicus]
MNVIDKISEKMLPIAARMNNQRHLTAIRDSFIGTMPLIMTASLFTLLNSLVFSNTAVQKVIDLSSLASLAVMASNGTLGIIAILVAYNIGVNLSEWYVNNHKLKAEGFSSTNAGGLAVSLMFLMMPATGTVGLTSGKTAEATGIWLQSLTGSGGLFVAMFASLIGTELFIRFSKIEKLKIHMPDGVPPAVASTFNSLIPEILVLLVVIVPTYMLTTMTSLSIPDILTVIIQKPLQGLVLSGPGMIVIQLVSDILWVFGLHGSSILSPITTAPQLASIQQNMEAFNAGKTVPNIVNAPFIGAYGLLGGGGCMLALVIALFIVSNNSGQRSIAKLASAPVIFNISEPIMFGLPVVMNPIFMIPAALLPSINLTIAYVLTSMNLVGRFVAITPWIAPIGIQTWLGTAGNIPAVLLTFALLILDVVIYIPFVMVSNKVRTHEELN